MPSKPHSGKRQLNHEQRTCSSNNFVREIAPSMQKQVTSAALQTNVDSKSDPWNASSPRRIGGQEATSYKPSRISTMRYFNSLLLQAREWLLSFLIPSLVFLELLQQTTLLPLTRGLEVKAHRMALNLLHRPLGGVRLSNASPPASEAKCGNAWKNGTICRTRRSYSTHFRRACVNVSAMQCLHSASAQLESSNLTYPKSIHTCTLQVRSSQIFYISI